jgi:hypothetical protein
MRTDKQRTASRANGSLSRGPVTPEGKARSSRNSTKHGLLARAVLLEGESRARFEEIVRDLTDTLKPATPVEHLLIGKMAAAHWRQIRAWAVEKQTGRSLSDHEGRLDRQFFRALTQYQRLKNFFAETNPPIPGAEPEKPAVEPTPPAF